MILKKGKSIDSLNKIKNADLIIIIIRLLRINFFFSFQTLQILAISENYVTIPKSKTKKIVATMLVLILGCSNDMLQNYIITTRLLCKKIFELLIINFFLTKPKPLRFHISVCMEVNFVHAKFKDNLVKAIMQERCFSIFVKPLTKFGIQFFSLRILDVRFFPFN